jgi:hypothetical protein
MILSPSNPAIFNGKPIYTMGLPELKSLKARCETYRANCSERGQAPEVRYLDIEKAVDVCIAKAASTGVKDAWTKYSTVYQRAKDAGYDPPALFGGTSVEDILAAAYILAEAVAVSIPLPGDDESMVAKMLEAMQESLWNGITAINDKYKNRRPW